MASSTYKPKGFDWVTARSKCTIGDVFERLYLQIRDDVETRQGLAKAGIDSFLKIEVHRENGEPFTVAVLQQARVLGRVTFDHTADVITAVGDHGEDISAALTLGRDGVCRLVINGEEREMWEFRKASLEGLFFRSY